jgi:GT2 family glycosyltransferase
VLSLSIIIPSHNGRVHLERSLASVYRHAPAGTQVIVVDDASTDDTASWLAERFPAVEQVTLPTNQGFCQAINAGLRRARGSIVELLNNDTEVRPGWAEACLRNFANPAVGSVAPLVLQMDRPDHIDSAGQEYHICGWATARGYGQPLAQHYLRSSEVFGASASSGFYRRSILTRLGGLVPEYEAYLEDTDLAFRLRWAGYRCIYEPAARVYHRGSSSYGTTSSRVLRLLARNEEFNFWINLPPLALWLGLVPHLGFVGIRAMRQALRGKLRAYLEGKCQALARWRWLAQRRRQLQAECAACGQWVNRSLSQGTDVIWQGIDWLQRKRCV